MGMKGTKILKGKRSEEIMGIKGTKGLKAE